MIRAHAALMRQAQEFFRTHLLGLYRFDAAPVRKGVPQGVDEVRVVGEPEEIPSDRRREMGVGRYRECVRLVFGPWELFVQSTNDQPPLGGIRLLDRGTNETLVSGPLDAETWSNCGKWIKSATHQRRNLHHEYPTHR